MDLHVLNTTFAALPVTVRMNLDTIPASQATEEAGVYFFYDPFIAIPPHASSHARMSCPVTSAVTLTTAQTHMHKWGLGGTAKLEDSTGALVQQMYTSSTWSDPPVTQWSAPAMTLKAGEQIDYECNYQNDDPTTIIQGLSAVTNEMCVFVGAYYPRDEKFETCGTTGSFADQGTAATYIGTGTATCEATLLCLQSAAQSSDPTPFYTCMVDSCPGVAEPLTQFLDCSGTVPQGGSVTTVCATQINTCIAATCTP
jgi:Copper type II ascorbate-dependent monooxygenase, C-terminal domain